MRHVSTIFKHFRDSLSPTELANHSASLLSCAETRITESLAKCCKDIKQTLESPHYRPADKDRWNTAVATAGTKRYDKPYPKTAGQFLALGERTWESFRKRVIDVNEWEVQVTNRGKGVKVNNKIVVGSNDLIEKTKKLFMAKRILNNPSVKHLLDSDRDVLNETAHQSFHKDARLSRQVWDNLLPQLAEREDLRIPASERVSCENALSCLKDPENYDDLDTYVFS